MLYQNFVTDELTNVTPEDYVLILMVCGNTSDFIDHLVPKHFVSAHGASHHAWAAGLQPSKSGADTYANPYLIS